VSDVLLLNGRKPASMVYGDGKADWIVK